MALITQIVEMEEELTRWRRHIHANPELGFQEQCTSDFVAGKLDEFGVQVFRNVGKTGVVGTLRNGDCAKSVGLRADMDALPIEELNSFDYRSTQHGCMHACGHDGHTTMLLAAAKYLAETRNFKGQVNFIFQPAEEGVGGAKAMIEDGLFDQFPCDALYAIHNWPGLPIGRFSVSPGVCMAAGAFFDINITGMGAHGASPHQSVDPTIIAAELVLALQTVISRNLNPSELAVLSITQIHAGNAYNVIPATAHLSGTVRTISMDTMSLIEDRITALLDGLAAGHGAKASLDFRIIFHPVVNALSPSEIAANTCASLVGQDDVIVSRLPSLLSEDFSFMSEEIPSCYLLMGNGENSAALHNPNYDFNDAAIVYGACFFAKVVQESLKTG